MSLLYSYSLEVSGEKEQVTVRKSMMNLLEKDLAAAFCFHCNVCGDFFKTKNDIDMHFRVHTIQKVNLCLICAKSYSTEKILKRHAKVVHEDGAHKKGVHRKQNNKDSETKERYFCRSCDYSTFNSSLYENHIVDLKCYKYSCNLCSFKTSHSLKLTAHNENSESCSVKKKLKCGNCDFETNQKQKLKIHFEVEHESFVYTCSDCEFKTSYLKDFDEHRKKEHDKTNLNFPCNKCKYMAATFTDLKLHGFEHAYTVDRESQEMRCNKCEYKTKSIEAQQGINMRRHIEKVHEKIRYKCNICDGEFTRTSTLKKHVTAKHSKSDQNILSCEQCEYKTTRKDAMNRHVRAMHEGKRFRCLLCPFSGYEKPDLKRHILKKHPELIFDNEFKLFSCDKCGYKTVTEELLKKHIMRNNHALKVELG